MSRAWLIWGPLGLVLLGAGYFGLRSGLEVSQLSETEAIERFAAQYLADRARDGTGQGASRADCVAYPAARGGGEAWLVVSCGPTPHDPARHYEYHVNRHGELAPPGAPET